MRCRMFWWIFILSSLFSLSGIAQQKWGKYSDENLKLTMLPEDSTACAVILFDVGEMDINVDFELVLKRHCRMKILKEEGKKYADIKIPFWHDDRIARLHAQSISPKKKKYKLGKKEIFEENINKNYKQKAFAIPGAEVGSIIEFSYTLYSEHLHFLEPWSFQHNIPVQLSRISVHLPLGFHYNAFQTNPLGGRLVEMKEEPFLNPQTRKSESIFIWEVEKIPALGHEPFMKARNDYLFRLYFQLVSFRNAYNNYQFISSWDDLSQRVSEIVQPQCKCTGPVKKQVEALTDGLSDEEKIRVLFDFVQKRVTTNEKSGYYPVLTAAEVLKNREGSPSEKNALLLAMLRHVGFDADPLLISTRRHGQLIENWPQLQQFDRMLVCLQQGARKRVFDASDHFCSQERLPPESVVEKGLLIGEKGKIIPVPGIGTQSRTQFNMEACLEPDGTLRGEAVLYFKHYSAVAMNRKLEQSKENNVLESWFLDRFTDAVIDTIFIQEKEEAGDGLSLMVRFHQDRFAVVNSDLIYCDMPLFHSFKKNPFQRKTRDFPVDYSWLSITEDRLKIHLPDDFEVDELPQDRGGAVGGVAFSRQVSALENRIEIYRRFTIGQMRVKSKYYEDLRTLYGNIVTFDQEQIVLKRKAGE